MEKRKYDSSIARMAGNIAAGLVEQFHLRPEHSDRQLVIAAFSVSLARAIAAEVERTEPQS